MVLKVYVYGIKGVRLWYEANFYGVKVYLY